MTRPAQIVIASKNPDKIAEIEAVLGSDAPGIEIVRGLRWPDIEETGASLEENALLKARAVVAATGLAAVADDTGLEVPALGGAPGIHTARYAGVNASYSDNVAKVLSVLGEGVDRSATFRTVIALVTPEGTEWVLEGRLEGEITRSARGDSGFGYDPIFEVGGRTLAEMTDAEKNQISHRALALQSLARELGR